MQWNLSLDHQLPGGVGLSVSYVGTRGVHIWGQSEANPCAPTGYDNAAQTIPNWVNTQGPGGAPTECPGANVVTPGGHTCPLFVAPNFSIPFPDGRANCSFASFDRLDTNSRTWYDGLQVSLQKKLQHGLEFQSAYTYSKNLDTTQGQLFIDSEIRTNPYAPFNFDKGRSVVDATHNLRFNTLYHFPEWKSDSVASKLVNGWWMGNIISIQSGYAFTPVVIGDQSLSGINGVNSYLDRPDRAANFNASKVILGKPEEWFDLSMFAVQPPGHLGDVSRGSFTGPGLFNWDFSMNKDTKLARLGEAGNLEFRAEFFNVFNHANFNQPNSSVTGFGAGQIFQARDGRDIQLALKVNF